MKMGMKLRAQQGLEVESWLRHRALLGTVAIGRAVLRAIPQSPHAEACGKDRYHLVLQEGQRGVEEVRMSRMVSMRQQGAWMRWEGPLEKKLN